MVSLSVCVRRLIHDLHMAESADRYAELAKHACCKTLNFGYVVVKKPISKRTAMHSTRPLTAAKRLKAAELKETTAPIAVRDMTAGCLLYYSHGMCALAAHGTWASSPMARGRSMFMACADGLYGRGASACHVRVSAAERRRRAVGRGARR